MPLKKDDLLLGVNIQTFICNIIPTTTAPTKGVLGCLIQSQQVLHMK
jgi:hypothetical protein